MRMEERRRREEEWNEVELGRNRKTTYADKVKQGNKNNEVNAQEKESERERRTYREKDKREVDENRISKSCDCQNDRKVEVRRERKMYDRRPLSRIEEDSVMELTLGKEKVDTLYKMFNKMEEKVKKLENLIENMLQTHNMKMDRIIKMIMEIKGEGLNKGKSDYKKTKIIEYIILQIKMSSIRILLWNAKRFENKKEELGKKMYKLKIDIGIVTEIKCSESKFAGSNNNVNISGYDTVLVNNYKKGQGKAGGVAIFAKKEMELQKLEVGLKSCNMEWTV